MSSFRKCVEVKKCILELLIRNENVIDGQADRQTDRHVQSNMPFFKRGHKKVTCHVHYYCTNRIAQLYTMHLCDTF